MATTRRMLLTGFAAAASVPLGGGLGPSKAYAGTSYPIDPGYSNTDLYRDLAEKGAGYGEGYDYARRYKRHEMSDDGPGTGLPYALTTVLAIHGGQIEPGTSEVCLGIAGYVPQATGELQPKEPGAPRYDYWMFEGLKFKNNSELHVTSSLCDDPVALSMAYASHNILSVHGCQWDQAVPDEWRKYPERHPDKRLVVVGGRNAAFKARLKTQLDKLGITVLDGPERLNGDEETNICNRTFRPFDESAPTGGAQLEMTWELRASLFGDTSAPGARSRSTNDEFTAFVNACRTAIADQERTQRKAW
ncbi:poly-gamma-glutamate hydrolase family protein [Streptomyces sp. NPDC089799]|uniref:poly-gamma-glutamate hydrolase family protein n=1 Tax=Streptomyces sp. NPDC089799 TaxID=3155066 RepID=UPI00343395F5